MKFPLWAPFPTTLTPATVATEGAADFIWGKGAENPERLLGDRGERPTLSQRRAEAVVSYLVSKDIKKSRLVAIGHGEDKLLVVKARTKAEHARNRRRSEEQDRDDPPAYPRVQS